ncbi:MAG: hypothetical protein LUG60_07210 [Erysipelotrichaceae bacterium]|nr:hypothetical protein [Erysipelotrichaceae bacterium]
MNYLSTKLKLISQINAQEFIYLINHIHQVNLNKDDFKQGMHHNDNITLFSFDDMNIIGISLIKHHRIYEYVYQVSTQDLYITIKIKGTSSLKSPDCILYLIENEYVLPHSLFQYDTPLLLTYDNIDLFYQQLQYINLPIIYLNNTINRYPKLKNELAMEAQGFAFIVYSQDDNIDNQIYQHLHLSPTSYIFYSSQDYKMITPTKHDKSITYKQNILRRLQDYMTKKDYPLSLDKLKMRYLHDEFDEMQEEEKNLLNRLEQQNDQLESQIQELFERIDHIDQSLSRIQQDNDYLSDMLELQDDYPILIKGDIKEFYEGEQKDIILEILTQEARNNPSNEIPSNIIKQNPEVGVRSKYLDEINKILLSNSKITSRMIDKLWDYGINIYKSEHYYAYFFNDKHYLITLSSTPSDVNAVRQMYRTFRKYYF